MNQFLLQKGCEELSAFEHLLEFALQKQHTSQPLFSQPTANACICIYCVMDGKLLCNIQQQTHTLYPGDVAVILPGQMLTSSSELPQFNTLAWVHIHYQALQKNNMPLLGKWSGLSASEQRALHNIFSLSHVAIVRNQKEVAKLLTVAGTEIINQEVGFVTRTNHLVDEVFILLARQLTRQNNFQRNFPQGFLLLEQALRNNLAHQWTVEEMGALMGLGNTAFSEKVKSFTGFSPLNYLINIRISEALKMLKRPEVHITDIALKVGFYSSQHFATTFKKLTGITPRDFRKMNLTTKK